MYFMGIIVAGFLRIPNVKTTIDYVDKTLDN